MKKRTFLAVFVLVLVLAVVGGLNAWALSAPEARTAPVATVTVDEGEAFLRHGGGSWQPVAADAALVAGDQVKTNAKSQATINFFDGASARLDENSEVAVRDLSVDEDNHASTSVTLADTAGRVWSRVVKLLDRDAAYTVQSSTVVATVRGTAFVTDVSGAEGDVVQVVDGLVGVARAPETLAAPAWEDVRSGEEAWMAKKGGRPAADTMQRRALAERFRTSAWFRKNTTADERFLDFVKQQRDQKLSVRGRILPGSPRYGLERFGERLRLALTTDPDARRRLRLAYEDRRFSEAVLLARAGKTKGMEKAWGDYLDGFRMLQREVGEGRMAPEQGRRVTRQMVGRMTEHRLLVAALNGAGVAVPEAMRERVFGERSDVEAMLSLMRTMHPEAFGEAPRLIAPLIGDLVPIDDATSTPAEITNTNSNTNLPAGQAGAPTNSNTNANTNTNAPPSPQSLAVIGTRSIMNTPDSQQFRAVLTFSDGSTQDVTTTAQWTLLGDPVGTLTRGNLVTNAAGNATVLASVSSGLSASFAVRVLPPSQPTLQSVSVAPASVTLRGGMSQAFTATAHYSDGSTKDVTATAVWSHSNPAAGSMSGNVFTAGYQYPSSTVVTAQYTDGSTASDTANVSVTF